MQHAHANKFPSKGSICAVRAKNGSVCRHTANKAGLQYRLHLQHGAAQARHACRRTTPLSIDWRSFRAQLVAMDKGFIETSSSMEQHSQLDSRHHAVADCGSNICSNSSDTAAASQGMACSKRNHNSYHLAHACKGQNTQRPTSNYGHECSICSRQQPPASVHHRDQQARNSSMPSPPALCPQQRAPAGNPAICGVATPGYGTVSGQGGRGKHLDTSTWAHPLSCPERGCLLLAGEDHKPGLKHAVVLVVAHDEVHGTAGVVLNKASPLTVADLQAPPDIRGFLPMFASAPLLSGGPCHQDHLGVLHPYLGVGGARCVVDGVYAGGLQRAVDLVAAGLAAPEDFTLVLGMTIWPAGQLEREVACGSWHVVAASTDLLLPRRQHGSGQLQLQGVSFGHQQRMWDSVTRAAQLA